MTGRWTGDAPDLTELKMLRKAVGGFPVFTGSGADEKNIKETLRFANGVIVSTALKSGANRRGEHNVKAYDQRIALEKVRKLVKMAR